MVNKSIYLLLLLYLGLISKIATLANTKNIELPLINLSKKSKIHSLPLNPTFQFSYEEVSEEDNDLLKVLLPLPKQDPREVSKLVKSTRDPFLKKINNPTNVALKLIKKIKLTGLYKSNNDIYAIITYKNGKEFSYKIGQLISEGVKLTGISIEKKFIEFTHEKETYRLKMKV